MRIAGIFAAAVLLAQSVGAESIERRGAADPEGEVVIGNVAGEVRVIGWNKAEIQVQAELSSGNQELQFEREGARTTIRVVLPKRRESHAGSDMIVHVPRGSSLSINTVSADQTVKEVRGAQRLQAVSGNIQTEVWEEEFEIKTVSGEIAVRGHGGGGLARVTTVSADVRLEDIGPQMELNSVSGDMRVRAAKVSRARIKTTNGDVELRTHLTPDARIDAEGVNGDLRFRLQGAIDAEFDIETFNGEIDNCFGPKPRRTREYGPGTELRFKEGDGSARVRIKALNGGIELCKG